MTQSPTVSIIVPTRNRCGVLSDCILTLIQQDYPADRYEVVIVDDGSADETQKIVTETATRYQAQLIRYVRHQGGVNAARNRGIAVSHGSIVGFIDDDELAPPFLVRKAIELLTEQPAALAVGGEYRSRLEGRRPKLVCRKCSETYKSIRAPHSRDPAIVDDLPGGCVFLWRRAFEDHGLFAENLSIPGDDTEWFRRASKEHATLLHTPELWIWHRFSQKQLRLGFLMRKHVSGMTNLVEARRLIGWESGISDDLVQGMKFLAHGLRRGCVVGIAQGLGRAALAFRWKLATRSRQGSSA